MSGLEGGIGMGLVWGRLAQRATDGARRPWRVWPAWAVASAAAGVEVVGLTGRRVLGPFLAACLVSFLVGCLVDRTQRGWFPDNGRDPGSRVNG